MPETENETTEEQPPVSEETTEEIALGEEQVAGEQEQEQEPQNLTEAEVAEALEGVALPEHTKALLSAREYVSAEELAEFVKQVVAEFKQATGSGHPVATRGKMEDKPRSVTREAIEKAQDAVNQRYLRTRISETKEEQK